MYILGAALLALWCQPLEALTVSSICDQLDALAKEVRKELAIRSPDHPACTEGDLQHEGKTSYNPSNAEATFIHSTTTQRFLKTI